MEESPCIKVRARRKENTVLLIVEDNGCGIRESEMGRIFNKGFTGSNGRKNRESTGMGLYICRELVVKSWGMAGPGGIWYGGKYTRAYLRFP